jgi:uncharacterized protein with HEPN domain
MYLEDLLLAMNRIAEYIEGLTFADFKRDYKTTDAVIRNFEIIGEAARNISQEVKEKYHEVPWDEMYLLRNKVFLGRDTQTGKAFALDHFSPEYLDHLWLVLKH